MNAEQNGRTDGMHQVEIQYKPTIALALGLSDHDMQRRIRMHVLAIVQGTGSHGTDASSRGTILNADRIYTHLRAAECVV